MWAAMRDISADYTWVANADEYIRHQRGIAESTTAAYPSDITPLVGPFRAQKPDVFVCLQSMSLWLHTGYPALEGHRTDIKTKKLTASK